MAKLVKIFKSWEVLGLFDARELNNIADSLNFRPLVSFQLSFHISNHGRILVLKIGSMTILRPVFMLHILSS